MKSNNLLWRYTDVTSLIHILKRKEITLLRPNSWTDKNDSKYLSIYKKKEKLKSLLVLCFTEAPETNHHWRVFVPNSSGVCVGFHKSRLLNAVDRQSGFRHNSVVYKKIKDLEDSPPETNELPFIKRYPYRDEKEYRIIFSDKKIISQYKHLK